LRLTPLIKCGDDWIFVFIAAAAEQGDATAIGDVAISAGCEWTEPLVCHLAFSAAAFSTRRHARAAHASATNRDMPAAGARSFVHETFGDEDIVRRAYARMDPTRLRKGP